MEHSPQTFLHRTSSSSSLVPSSHQCTSATGFPLLSHSTFSSQWGVIGHTWERHDTWSTSSKKYIWLHFESKGSNKGSTQLRGEGAHWVNTTIRARYNFPCRTKQLCQWATRKHEEQTVTSAGWRVEPWECLDVFVLRGWPGHRHIAPVHLCVPSPPATGQTMGPAYYLEVKTQQHAGQMRVMCLRLSVVLE